jgi:ABC-type branched-subunit amino acid transport system substrate-binding protein
MKSFKSFFLFLFLASGAHISAFARPINIAAIYPFSGEMKGTKCIVEAYNHAHIDRAKFNLQFMNSIDDPMKILAQLQDAIYKQFDLAFGTRTSQEALVTSNELNKLKIPFIATMASNPEVTSNKPFAMRMLSNSNEIGFKFAKLIISQKAKKVTIVENVSQIYSAFYAKTVNKHLSELQPDIQIKHTKILIGSYSFAKVAKEIIDSKPDILYLPLYTIETTGIIKELVKFKPSFSILSNGGVTEGEKYFRELSLDAPQMRFYFNSIWSKGPEGPYKDEYLTLLKKNCSMANNDVKTALAYDTIKFIHNSLIEYKNKQLGLKFIDFLKTRTFEGVTGRLKYGKDGEPIREVPLMMIQANQMLLWGLLE